MTQEIKDRLDNWFTQNYKWLEGEIRRNIAKDQMRGFGDDLIHHMILFIYNLPEHKLEQMLDDDKLGWYILSGAGLQLRSKTSPFYITYRRQRLQSRSGVIDSYSNPYDLETYEMKEMGTETLDECFLRAMGEIHWYLATLLRKKFIEGESYQKMYEYYNISKTHLIKDINTALNEVREICRDTE